MTRSLGDYTAHQVGCSYIPEIRTYETSLRDKMLVLASDGIWEFMSNQEVAQVVYPFYWRNDPSGAAE